MVQQLCPVILGREAELEAARTSLRQAVTGNGQAVLLVGEPGIGKSRLAREVVGWAMAQGVPVITGRAVPASAPAAFRPVTEALFQLFRDRPLPEDHAMDRWRPLLEPLLPGLIEPSATGDVPAGVRGEAVLQVLGRTVPGGVVIVLEDLHWADPDTVALVEYLADNLVGTSVLLVLTLRDGPASSALDAARRLRGRVGVTYLALGRLTHRHLAAMVRACRPDAAADLVERIERTSEGVPLLVEELLATPGLPADFAATVKARLGALSEEHRQVVEAAAVLGRQFDWELLPQLTGLDEEAVAGALAAATDSLLLATQGAELRFRHALTREAVLDTIIAPRQRQLARVGLDALTAAHPTLDDGRRELAADLAARAGDRPRAGALLAASGRRALAWGALATAADTLRRAADLLAGTSEQSGAELDLVQALALAGRVEEAAAVGGRLITRLCADPNMAGIRVEAHLRLAQAAVAASRWQMARHHLDEARQLSAAESMTLADARIAVLDADVMIGRGDYETARALTEAVLQSSDVAPDIRCHAFEIVGRTYRSNDLSAARTAFESALISAEGADLPLWRLRALHELGTIDMFDHAGVERLLQARRAAEEMGALSTGAILDLQLAAAFTCRWDLSACDAHAESAIAVAERLGLEQVRAQAFVMLTGSAGMRADVTATERYAALTVAAVSGDRMLEGFCWAMRAMALLVAGDEDAAIEPWGRGIGILAKLPHAEPAAVRALWPLVLAARADRRAEAAIAEARRLGVATFHLNAAMIGYADAIVAARQGDARRARELLALADAGWTNCDGWADLARLLAAPTVATAGLADTALWLQGARDRFDTRGLTALAQRCQALLDVSNPNPWSAAGISAREADVLRLVAEGLANKEVAAKLHLSPRTIEKHIESLLRKSGARSRTELVARLLPTSGARPQPASRSRTT